MSDLEEINEDSELINEKGVLEPGSDEEIVENGKKVIPGVVYISRKDLLKFVRKLHVKIVPTV